MSGLAKWPLGLGHNKQAFSKKEGRCFGDMVLFKKSRFEGVPAWEEGVKGTHRWQRNRDTKRDLRIIPKVDLSLLLSSPFQKPIPVSLSLDGTCLLSYSLLGVMTRGSGKGSGRASPGPLQGHTWERRPQMIEPVHHWAETLMLKLQSLKTLKRSSSVRPAFAFMFSLPFFL